MKKNDIVRVPNSRYFVPVVALAALVSCEDQMLQQEESDETSSSEDVVIPNTHPNIILIMADDMGRDDMSYRNNMAVSTPNLDSLARISTRFENFYVNSVSAPTRASLLTGRHFLRCGVSGVHAGRDFVNMDEVMIGEALQDAGYKTGMWGKWHSGKSNGYYPWQRGFDEAYMASLYHHEDNAGTFTGYYDGQYYNGETLNLDGWTDAAMTDMAIDFISRNKTEKFFAYIPYLAAHANWEAPDEYIQTYKQKGQSTNFATLNGMLSHLDHQVGRVMAAVDSMGLMDNTVIIFMSDNGPNYSGVDGEKLTDAEWEQRNPSGYSGNKSKNLENGIRSPLFVYWRDHIQSYDNYSVLSVCDIFPTLCDIAGTSIPSNCKSLDGQSFYNLFTSPFLTDNSRTLYISHWTPLFDDSVIGDDGSDSEVVLTDELIANIDPELQRIGMRRGDEKLLLNESGEDALSLWNLADDPTESRNLCSGSTTYTASALTYKSELIAWYEDVLADDGSFTVPTFQIGYEDQTYFEILAYAPTYISSGLVNDTQELSGFDKAGESATYAIDVVREARYYLRLKASSSNHDGEQVFTVSTNKDDNCGEILWNAKSLTSKLLAIDLTSDITSITITLNEDIDTTIDLKTLTLEHKYDLNSSVPVVKY
ncbi:MAG: sulfatase-like hydrolase/transferase [Bacteroidales bacterium]